jgi:hypothetical protein
MSSIDDTVSLDGLSVPAQRIVADLRAQWKAEERVAVSRKATCVMLGDIGATKGGGAGFVGGRFGGPRRSLQQLQQCSRT